MAYKASMQERFHRNFNSRIRTDSNTLIRSTGIAANLESLYLFNGDERARPNVISNLKQNLHHIDMTWNGDGYLLGDGGAKFADNGNATLNTSGVVRDIDSAWSVSKQGKSRVFVLNVEWKSQALAQCYVAMSSGFQFFRSASGTVFTISIENVSTHRITWTIDTAAFRDGDPVTIVAMADMRAGNNTSRCYLNGVDLGVGAVNGTPFNGTQTQPLVSNYVGRASSWNDYYGFDGKIGLFGHSFEFPSNIPPSLADLKALSIDPYRVLLNTQRSKIDLPDILLPVAADWEIEFEARCGFLPNNDNLVPILTASDYAPNMSKGLNIQAAGNTAWGSFPDWKRQAGTGAIWSVEIEFEITELSGIVYLITASSSTVSSLLRVETDGTLAVRSSSNNILFSAPGAIQLYKKYKVKIAREDDTLIKLYLNDIVIDDCPVADLLAISYNQFSRYSTTTYRPYFILYSLKFNNVSGTSTGVEYYSAEWNASTIPSDDFALNWPSVGATHNITINNATVEIDPYYTKTPYMTGIFTNSSGQLVWCEGINNYTTNGFAAAHLWGGNATRYWSLSTAWAGTGGSSWSAEIEFMITSNAHSGTSWSFIPISDSASGTSLLTCTVDAAQTTMTVVSKDTTWATINTANVTFTVGKWYKIKVSSDSTNWILTIDDVPVSTVANTTATGNMTRIASATCTSNVGVAVRSFVTVGGSYATTFNTSNTNGKGTVWKSSGTATLTAFGSVPDSVFWYDVYQRRFISDAESVIPQERHLYKISKVSGVITITRDSTVTLSNAWKQTKDLYINRIANASTNGTEYGQRIHLYSLRIGTETWTPDATKLASSVNSSRDAVSSGVSFVNIPDSYIYCPTNGQTYANFSAIPGSVINLTNVVFELSGFVRNVSNFRPSQSPVSTITVKAVAGQEFAGKIYDDAVATAMFCSTSAGNGGLCLASASTGTLNVSDVVLTSSQNTSSGLMGGVVGISASATGQTLNLTNMGVLSHYGMANAIDGAASNTITINNVVTVGAENSLVGTVNATKLTAVNNHPTSTTAVAISGAASLSNVVAVKPSQSNSSAASGTFVNTATNDSSGSYGLFATISDFVDSEYGDYRLKSSTGLYKAGVGAYSTTYISPSFVANQDQEGFYKGDVYGGGMYFDYFPISTYNPSASFTSVGTSTSSFNTKELDFSGHTSTNTSVSTFNQIEISKGSFASSGTVTSTFASKEINNAAWTSTGSIATSFGVIEVQKPSFASTGVITTTFSTKGIDKPSFVSSNVQTSSFATAEWQFGQFSSTNVQTSSFNSKEVSKLGFTSNNVTTSAFDVYNSNIRFESINVSSSSFVGVEKQYSSSQSTNSQVSSIGVRAIKKSSNVSSNVVVTSVQTKEIDKSQVTSSNVVATSIQVTSIKKSSYSSSNVSSSSWTINKIGKVSASSTTSSNSSFYVVGKVKSQLNSSNNVAASFDSRKLCYPTIESSNSIVSYFVSAITFGLSFESSGISFSGFNWEDVMRDQLILYTNMEGFLCSVDQLDGYQVELEMIEGYA